MHIFPFYQFIFISCYEQGCGCLQLVLISEGVTELLFLSSVSPFSIFLVQNVGFNKTRIAYEMKGIAYEMRVE